jgi:hypothetical protein
MKLQTWPECNTKDTAEAIYRKGILYTAHYKTVRILCLETPDQSLRKRFPLLQLFSSEAKFLDVIRTKVFRVFLLAFHSHLY